MSKIEWTDITINPIVGCRKISEGCQNCYAEKMAYRLKCMGIEKYQGVVDQNGWTGKVCFDISVFDNIPKTSKRIFCGSMTDMFHEKIIDNDDNFLYLLRIFVKMFYYKNHIFQILTKRPHKMLEFCVRAGLIPLGLPSPACSTPSGEIWPPNVWAGVTVENQKQADERIPILLQIPAQVRFISVEPMLEKIDIATRLMGFYSDTPNNIDWVICGAETGHGKRPMQIDWAFDLQKQCEDSCVPFFFKKDSTGKQPDGLRREFPNG